MVQRIDNVIRPAGASRQGSSPPACETPYPTEQQFANAHHRHHGFPFGYGGGPGCNGLTPSQDNSIYGAPHAGPRGKGAGVNTGGVRAVRLPAFRHRHLGADLLRPALHPAAASTSTSMAARCTRSARRATPARPTSTATPVTSRSTPTSRCSSRSRRMCKTPDRLQRAERLDRADRARRVHRDRERRHAPTSVSSSWAVCENDVTAGYVQAENVDLRADGAAGPEHVRRRGRHRRVLLHPLRRHHGPQRPRPAVASPG